MKKTYGKPIVSFESFAFSSNIAGGCSDITGMHTSKTNCAVYGTFSDPNQSCEFMDNGFAIFYSTNGECIQTPQENDEHNLCYHVSTDASRMFMS